MRLVAEIANGLADLLYPPVCLVCERPCSVSFCAGCREELVHDPFPTCPLCGSTVGPHTNLEDGCSRCRAERFSFSRVVRLGAYGGIRRDLILRMKHEELTARAVSAVFAERIAPSVEKLAPSMVIPAPLHWIRQWRRGYNQADVMAKALAEKLHVPCRPKFLKRTRSTPPQTGLSPTARRENLRGAIVARRLHQSSLKGKVALLVDDVMTTGSTAQAATIALKAAGFEEVCVAVIAHG